MSQGVVDSPPLALCARSPDIGPRQSAESRNGGYVTVFIGVWRNITTHLVVYRTRDLTSEASMSSAESDTGHVINQRFGRGLVHIRLVCLKRGKRLDDIRD